MKSSINHKRRFSRRTVDFSVDVTFSNLARSTLQAKDISQGGMFIASTDVERPNIGELLHIKLATDTVLTEIIPFEDAVVVHKGKSGFGLSFVEMNGVL